MSFLLKPEPNTETGINRYDLLQSASEEVIRAYKQVLEPVSGSFTVVADNDAEAKIRVALAQLRPTEAQAQVLRALGVTLRGLNLTDPKRMNFTVARAQDDEIYLRRCSLAGVSKLIINDDGSIAYSFLGLPGAIRPDVLQFVEEPSNNDWEGLAYSFFQW